MQPAPLVSLVAYPSLQLVVTLDRQGLITGWKAETGSEWASFRLPTFCSSMEACGHPEGPFLMVSDPALRSPSGPNHLLVKATMVGGVWLPLLSRPCLSGSSLPITEWRLLCPYLSCSHFYIITLRLDTIYRMFGL